MRSRAAVAVAVVTGVMLAVATGPGAGANPPGGPAGPSPAGPGDPASSYQVTLVTGDVLQVEQSPAGGTQVGVAPDAGPSGAFRVYERDGHTHVVPVAAQPYLDSGLLDPRLFDVTGLVAQEYDDASTDHLPLLIEYESAAAARSAGATLGSVSGRPVSVDKSDVREFWDGIATDGTRARLAGGAQRIWLDGRVEAMLDESVPQIGAPAAWAEGYDGDGVTVAVLDTGIDADHPDLAGNLAGARAFTPDGEVTDQHGHGTHVASIAAGAGPDYPGVAPGAELLAGKVLGDTGFGRESWIIAGMEWAVGAGADVVNLSLGTYPTDGTDPMSRAVNRLSASSDALFVIAAGNSGPSARSVSAPATADAALAVGNARLDGTLSRTSSRGPRVVDNAIKPELTAPGTGITAARAGGGHRDLSGTSMAAPHVAGAAALLAQQHPERSAEELKADLIANSVPLTGASVWEQGAGRLAVDRAVAQTVRVSDGVLDLGYLDLDTGDDALVRTETISYRNDGTAPVTLDLRVDLTGDGGAPAPAGAVTASPDRLNLAPGEEAEVKVRRDATGVPAGQYAGRLVATGGPSPVTTALGFYRQGDLADLTISLTDRRGQPASGHVTLFNYERGVFEPGGFIEGSIAPGQARTFRVPRATYSITAQISTPDESGRFLEELSMVADPQHRLDRNGELVLDARDAVPVQAHTPREAAPEVLVLGWTRGPEDGNAFVDSILVLPEAGEVERVSAAPTEPVTDGTFDVYTTWHLAVPWLSVRAPGERFVPTYFAGSPRYEGAGRPRVVDAGTDPAGQDLAGAVALIREQPGRSPAAQVRAAAAAGAVLALVTPAEPGLLRASGAGLPIPAATLPYADGQRLRELRPDRLRLAGVVDSPYTYDLTFHAPGRVPDSMTRRFRAHELATIDAQYHDDGSQRPALLTRYPTAPCHCTLIRMVELHHLPYQRTEYVSTGDGAVWSAAVQAGLTSNLRAHGLSYAARRPYTEEWGAAPLAPTAASTVNDLSARDGDTLRLRVASMADPGGRAGGAAGPATGILYRDGEPVAELFGGYGDVPVPPAEAEYRLSVSVSNGTPESGRLSTDTQTEWTFRSGEVTGEPATLPLLSAAYQLPVSASNAIDPRRLVPLQLAGVYPDQRPASLHSVEAWVSYDDGTRWRAALVVRQTRGTALVMLPAAGAEAGGGHASLRVHLSDRDGNTVAQTIIRAYRLAGG